jgi:hypothetical protein
MERNNKILEMSNKGNHNQREIAKKFGISFQRVGQIVQGWNLYSNNLKKSAMPFVDAVSKNKPKSFSKEELISAVLDSNMDNNFKLKLVEILLSK